MLSSFHTHCNFSNGFQIRPDPSQIPKTYTSKGEISGTNSNHRRANPPGGKGISRIRNPTTAEAENRRLNWTRRLPKSQAQGIRRPNNKNSIVKYAKWEENQKDFKRARSIYERAIELNYRDHTIWLKYAEFEMKNKFINHARNVWDRAVNLLPKVDQLWHKYTFTWKRCYGMLISDVIFLKGGWRGSLINISWFSHIKFELRYNEVERERAIFERLVECHCNVNSWISYANFEIKNGGIGNARYCYERAVDSW